MEQRFAYYDGSRWIGGFDSRQAALDHSTASIGTAPYPESLLEYWQEVVTATPSRRPAAAPAGSLAAFLALGQ